MPLVLKSGGKCISSVRNLGKILNHQETALCAMKMGWNEARKFPKVFLCVCAGEEKDHNYEVIEHHDAAAHVENPRDLPRIQPSL